MLRIGAVLETTPQASFEALTNFLERRLREGVGVNSETVIFMFKDYLYENIGQEEKERLTAAVEKGLLSSDHCILVEYMRIRAFFIKQGWWVSDK